MLDSCNVVWTSASKDSSGSMPLGNGDIGINAWVEKDGDLLFYIGKTDSWDERGSLLKLGRVRMSFLPNPFEAGASFRQELHLQESEIIITAGPADREVSIRLWVDAHYPVIRVEAHGRQPFALMASMETWRTAVRVLSYKEGDNSYVEQFGPDEQPTITADTVLTPEDDCLIWYHRNERSVWPVTLRLQGLENLIAEGHDPLLHRTFGGLVRGDGLVNDKPGTLTSITPSKDFDLSIHLLTRQTPTSKEWVLALKEQAKRVEAVPVKEAYAEHCRWWNAFWQRSRIVIETHAAKDDNATCITHAISRGYALQRFLVACGGRGAYPIKFNGSIFTVCGSGYDADYRLWGGPYWFQNTRLIYWPLIAAGDNDLLQTFFAMYRDVLPLAEQRNRIYYGHEGVFFPETMHFWGAYHNSNYGWDRQKQELGLTKNTYIRRYWQGGLELVMMMLDYYDITGDKVFLRETLLPIGTGVTTFFDRHWPRDAGGKIRFEPAQSLETYHVAVNPLPEIAGLGAALPRLLALPHDCTTEEQRQAWTRLIGELPELPTRRVRDEPALAPAETYNETNNMENPELYAIFPYRLYGVGKPDLAVATRAYDARGYKWNRCWSQDVIQAALLGKTHEARDLIAARFTDPTTQRFPVFWNSSPDWTPDMDHGGAAMTALQLMLLQVEKDTIRLFPAWPKEWNVSFKLHAPQQTVIECEYRDGRVQRLVVTPAERAINVKIMDPQ